MSQPPPTKHSPSISFKQLLIKTHHGRAYFLWGSWLATMMIAVAGMAALRNPQTTIPLLDRMLGQVPTRTAALVLQEAEPVPPSDPSSNGEDVSTTQEVTRDNPDIGQPIPPIWVYGLIVFSSLFGVALLTYALYKLSQQSVKRQLSSPPTPPQSVGRSPLPIPHSQDS